ncbi:MAG: DUF1499 domain-containing protein [Pseudomonadota bacterium]
MMWTVAALVAAVIVVAAVVFLAVGRERSWQMIAGSADRGRFDLAEVKRSPTANDALACTPGLRDDCDFELPRFDAAPSDLADRIALQIETVDPLARRVDDRSDIGHLRYVTYSPNMRFPDLVNIEIVPVDEDRVGVVAYAHAQLGRLDFGANRARLERYFDGL